MVHEISGCAVDVPSAMVGFGNLWCRGLRDLLMVEAVPIKMRETDTFKTVFDISILFVAWYWRRTYASTKSTACCEVKLGKAKGAI
jgi:hypothetical protein